MLVMTFVGSWVFFFFFSQNDLDVERCFWELSSVTDFFPPVTLAKYDTLSVTILLSGSL